jgi:hypothetical protein
MSRTETLHKPGEDAWLQGKVTVIDEVLDDVVIQHVDKAAASVVLNGGLRGHNIERFPCNAHCCWILLCWRWLCRCLTVNH